MKARWLLWFLPVLALGCRTAQLSGGGSQVQIGPSAPVDYGYDPASCKPLGYISGRGGGSFGGGWISNDRLVEYAMNDLRNKAAELGANFVQHESPQMGIAGDKDGVTTSTATVSGTAYKCGKRTGTGAGSVATKADSEQKDNAAPDPKKQETAEPTGVAGIAYGMAAARVTEACSTAGHEATEDGGALACSGTPQAVGFPASVRTTLCSGHACKIEVATRPDASAREPLVAANKLHEQISAKYGEPEVAKAILPGDCRTNAAPCLLDGSASLTYRWKSAKGATIELKTDKTDAGVRVLLTYAYEAPPAL